MNSAHIVRKPAQPPTSPYDRKKFLEAMEKYSKYVSSLSWFIEGPSAFFVEEPEPSSAEPTV
ncbi:hypothetical protein JKF63_06801 [Porcisia hertigi]|uniref:Uncharacterized protein n=1 Tax=Porcisia hertigi TaxID=2761500 RepID=A0A836LJ48_9TRYP|nr:hypothetical protein JKF63_06801 [Porcisia hertigi]